MQPIVFDEHGTARFKRNTIVRYLLDHGGIDMNMIAQIDFDLDDYTQFIQLIGYSVSGAGDLEGFDENVLEKADGIVAKKLRL